MKEQLAAFLSRKVSRREHLKILFKGIGVVLALPAISMLKIETAYAQSSLACPVYMVHFTHSRIVEGILHQNIVVAGRKPVKPSYAAEAILGIKPVPEGGMFCITFDDGYINQYEQAVPVLRRWGSPGGWCLIGPDWLRKGADGTGRHISLDMIKKLAEEGDEIISHSNTHRDLVALWGRDREALVQELDFSKRDLQIETGQAVDGFCYPNGSQNGPIQALVAERYKYALGTFAGSNHTQDRIHNMFRVRS